MPAHTHTLKGAICVILPFITKMFLHFPKTALHFFCQVNNGDYHHYQFLCPTYREKYQKTDVLFVYKWSQMNVGNYIYIYIVYINSLVVPQHKRMATLIILMIISDDVHSREVTTSCIINSQQWEQCLQTWLVTALLISKFEPLKETQSTNHCLLEQSSSAGLIVPFYL